MKRMAVVLAAIAAMTTGTAAAQNLRNEISLFGSWENVREPEDVKLQSAHLRYGMHLTPQAVATLGISHTRFKSNVTDARSSMLTVGAKYYFSPPAANRFVPFVDGAVGFADIDTGRDNSTDFTWEIGGGAAYFFTEATSVDAVIRWYNTDFGVETEGVRLFVGITTRF
jgi:opacity protein-like surface antigen